MLVLTIKNKGYIKIGDAILRAEIRPYTDRNGVEHGNIMLSIDAPDDVFIERLSASREKIEEYKRERSKKKR